MTVSGRTLAATTHLACIASDVDDPVCGRIRTWAVENDIAVSITAVGTAPETPDPLVTVGLAVGGDGTFLEAVRAFAPRDIPIAGVDRGRLSFLSRIPADAVTDALTEIVAGEARIQSSQRFAVSGPTIDASGVNDITLESDGADTEYRQCRIEAFIETEYLGQYPGDGVLVTTPTGSTAYGLSARGPVHLPGSNTLQVTPLHSRRIGAESLVFDADRTLTLIPQDTVSISVDGGRTVGTVSAGDPLWVTGISEPASIIRTSHEQPFMSALVAKLRWALRDDRGQASAQRTPKSTTAAAYEQGDSREPPITVASQQRATPEPPATTEYRRELRVAREATVAAGEFIHRSFALAGHSAPTITQAERRAAQIIITAIDGAFPDDRINPERLDESGRVWLYDALDGRTNAEHGNPNYCSSLALLVDGVPTVGVVFVPAADECFAATAGGQAVRNGKPIEPTDCAELDEAMLLSGYDPDGEFLRRCYQHARGVRRLGSQALNLCSVAAGTADACWEFDTRPRDVAGALCILRTAGGTVTTPQNEPFRTDAEARTPLLASNGPLHPALRALLSTGR